MYNTHIYGQIFELSTDAELWLKGSEILEDAAVHNYKQYTSILRQCQLTDVNFLMWQKLNFFWDYSEITVSTSQFSRSMITILDLAAVHLDIEGRCFLQC